MVVLSKMIDVKNNNIIFLKGLLFWGIATLFYFFDNLLRVVISVLKPELSMTFACSAAELGHLSAAYLWAYGIMQIPAGLLVDRIGPRIMLTIASAFCVVGCYLFAIADTLLVAILGRFVIGIGASFTVVGCSKIAASWFSPKRFALFVGLMASLGMSGSAFGLAAIYKIIGMLSNWRTAVYWSSIIALIICIMVWGVIRDAPYGIKQNSKHIKNKKISFSRSLVEVIFCDQAWYASIYAGFMYVPSLTFGAMWGIPYLVEAYKFSRDQAGFLVGLIFVGWIFGAPIYGWISDFIKRRNMPMYFACITSLIISLIIIYMKNLSIFSVGILMFLLGLCSSGFILAFAVVREKNRPEIAGTAVGFVNMLNTFLGGAIFQYVVGKVLDWTGSDYQTALLVIPTCLLSALITLFFLKETHCKHEIY